MEGTLNIVYDRITFRDSSTLKVESTITAHSSGIASMDMQNNNLVTCGYSLRNGTLVIDPLLKVYDIRTMKSLSPISCNVNPSHLKFLSPNKIIAASQNGSIQICGIFASNELDQFMNANISGYLTHLDVSSAGSVAIGDSYGGLSIWLGDQGVVNTYSRETGYIDLDPSPLPVINDDTPLSCVGLPYYTSPLLSVWSSHLRFPVGRVSPQIPQHIMEKIRMVDFVGYAPNPRTFKRNQVASISQEEIPKFRSEQVRDKRGRSNDAQKTEGFELTNQVSISSGIPNYYKKVEIQYSKFGIDDFDFGFYNKTIYGGLESHISNSYLNPLLQMLYFIWPLRELSKTHIRHPCVKEPCLSCELGFLFRMLECCEGVNCQASNFLRAFGLIPQARALGLLVVEPEQAQFGRLIQTSCRFILERVHSELADNLVENLLGMKLSSSSLCDKEHVFVRETNPFVVDLAYADAKKSKKFVDVLQHSINRVSNSKAWCGSCNAYAPTKQTKSLATAPYFMCINANINSSTESELWNQNNWLPFCIAIILNANKFQIINMDSNPDISEHDPSSVYIYDLRATIAEIKLEGKAHLVGHMNGSYFFNLMLSF